MPFKLYLYAIVDQAVAVPSCGGLDQAPLRTISRDGLAAVVSETMHARLRPERKHLGAHQQVLRELLKTTTPLPLSFGTLASSESEVKRLLQRHAGDFRSQLDRVADCVEMGLRLTWEVENIFAYFVEKHPELAEMRDELQELEKDGPSPALHAARLEIGRRFEQLLTEEREAAADRLQSDLGPHCVELSTSDPKGDLDVAQVNCLVRRDSLPGFEQAVERAASSFDANYAFHLSGPWCPHHFVRLEIGDAAA